MFEYAYDFSDDWRHDILLKAILAPDAEAFYSRCIAAPFRKSAVTLDDLDELAGYVASASNPAKNRRLRKEWESIYVENVAILKSCTDRAEPARARIMSGHNATADGSRRSAMKKFCEKNLDVLQNLEFGVIEVYRADRSLLDIDAKDAIDALIRHYHAEEEQRTPPAMNLGERAERVFLSVQRICEFRLGRSPFPGETAGLELGMPVAELVRCLREIQKSIPRWTRQGGRKGYLDFVSQFLP